MRLFEYLLCFHIRLPSIDSSTGKASLSHVVMEPWKKGDDGEDNRTDEQIQFVLTMDDLLAVQIYSIASHLCAKYSYRVCRQLLSYYEPDAIQVGKRINYKFQGRWFVAITHLLIIADWG